jgi:hypothetical protein
MPQRCLSAAFIAFGCLTACLGCSRSDHPRPAAEAAPAVPDTSKKRVSTTTTAPGGYSLTLTLTDNPPSDGANAGNAGKGGAAPNSRPDR